MLNPSILEKEIGVDEDETDENVVEENDEKPIENNEITLDDSSSNKRPVGNVSSNKKGNEVDEGNKNINEIQKNGKIEELTKEKEDGIKQTRRSERIRKQRVEIDPDDIGDNDDENDESYR